MNLPMRSYTFVGLLVALLFGCAESAPPDAVDSDVKIDRILHTGKIYTGDLGMPWAEAVAIAEGRYVAVGANEEVLILKNETTEVIDLQGAFAMAGINDLHIHPLWGGVKELFECQFAFTADPQDIVAALTKCAEQQPDVAWIRGGQWDSSFFENHKVDSPRGLLDAISDTHAIYLTDDSGHNGWVNSKALELAGISANSTDPEGGYIQRDELGQPNGVLLETATRILDDIVPAPSAEQFVAAAERAADIVTAYGITGMKDAGAFRPAGQAFSSLDRQNKLQMHVAVAQRTSYGKREGPLDFEHLESQRDKFASKNVYTNFVKLFLDGVPTVARTAAMLRPYAADEIHGHEYTGGAMHLTPERLSADLAELDRRGFTVKIHAAGDRSVRAALDAIAAARQLNGRTGLRHEIAHAGYISEEDIPRFVDLDAVADFSPYLWHPSPIIKSVVDAVGHPRGEQYWPTRDLLDAGVNVIAGSDWPAAVPNANPWVGIEAMVTRADPREDTPGTLWPEQAISLGEALYIFTQAGANALGLGDITGAVVAGRSADLIVLNHNLFGIPPTEISNTQVQQVYFRGERIIPN